MIAIRAGGASTASGGPAHDGWGLSFCCRFPSSCCRFRPENPSTQSHWPQEVGGIRESFLSFCTFFPQPFLYTFVQKREREKKGQEKSVERGAGRKGSGQNVKNVKTTWQASKGPVPRGRTAVRRARPDTSAWDLFRWSRAVLAGRRRQQSGADRTGSGAVLHGPAHDLGSRGAAGNLAVQHRRAGPGQPGVQQGCSHEERLEQAEKQVQRRCLAGGSEFARVHTRSARARGGVQQEPRPASATTAYNIRYTR